MRKIINIIAVLLIYSGAYSQTSEWIVPEEDSKKLSPFKFTKESIVSGKEVFMQNCKTCHGEPGKYNYQPLQPIPGDITDIKIQRNTDGDIYYKVMEGKGAMPSFKNILSSTEIWDVVAYVRSFNNEYKQEVAEKLDESDFAGQTVIDIFFDKEKNELVSKVYGDEDAEKVPIRGTEVQLIAKRYFGNLPIDKAMVTDKNGVAKFTLPLDLPGDSSGMVEIRARLSNQERFGQVYTDTSFAFGIPTNKPGLTDERAMWNVGQKAPLWVIISYVTALLLVWGTIFFVLFQLRKIMLLGKGNDDN